MNEFGIFSKQAALDLDISTSNLRKWSLLLEEAGYKFERNDKDQRIYYERDLNVLSQIKFYLEKDRNIENAVKAAMVKARDKDNTQKTLSVIREKTDEITLSKSDLNEMIGVAVEEALSVQRQEMEKFFRGIQQIAVSLQEERKALPSPKDEVFKRYRLRKEAIEIWNQKPEDERMVRVSLFRKIENESRRRDFIEDYIYKKMVEEYENDN